METSSCFGESIPPDLRDSQLEGPDGGCVCGGGEFKMKRKTLILKTTDYKKFLK